MAIISANVQYNRGEHLLLDYSSLQVKYSDALAWAQDVNSNAAVGQFIYLEEAETIDGVEYAKGPYVVDAIGEDAVLTPLSKSVAGNTDLSDAIVDLKSDVSELKSGLETTDSSVATLEEKFNKLPKTFVTDVKVGETSLVDNGVANLSNFVQKDGDKILSTNDYTTFEKEKLAGIEVNAQVNYIKSVGNNLDVDDNGKLTVTIPNNSGQSTPITVTNDKILTLGEDGVLKSDLIFDKETIGDAEYLVVKGKNGAEIGKVATAEFTVDGVLDSVDWSKEEGKENILVLTFNTAAGKHPIEVNFGKYVDAYSAGEGLTLTGKAFAVDFTKVESAGTAAIVKSEIETELANYAKSVDVYSKTNADSTFVKKDGYVAYSDPEKTKLTGIAEGAQVNVLEGVQLDGTDIDISGKKVNIPVATKNDITNIFNSTPSPSQTTQINE